MSTKANVSVRLKGRILFLTEDPKLVVEQLEGNDLAWDNQKPWNNPKLRDDISTDEITPAHMCFYYDETLGETPYVGLRCSGESPVRRGDVKRAGFVASVSGKRRGKGSSREQSPYAELAAGIRLVIGESIERIYRQNCQNLGLLASMNFGLVDKIRNGDEIALSEFTEGEDEITRQVIEYGSLFSFNVARLNGRIFLPPIKTTPRPMTISEKIFARHMIGSSGKVGTPAVKPGDTGFTLVDLRFSHEYVTPMAATFYDRLVGKKCSVRDPGSIKFFRDHLTFLDEAMSQEQRKSGLLDLAGQLKSKQENFAKVQAIQLHGELKDRKGSEGICHSLMLERYTLPGQINVGSDSHTSHLGAIGCLAFGIGATDLFNAWITKDVRVRIPESVKVIVSGERHRNVTAKDFVLRILASDYVKTGMAVGKVVEFAGDAISELSIDERATMTNMVAEIGGFTGIVAPDRRVVEFLADRRGMGRAEAEKLIEGLHSDPGAVYTTVIRLDAADVIPMVAVPNDPGNGKPVRDLGSRVDIDIAYGGSCTAGKNEDMELYARVLKDALRDGKQVAASVAFYIQFGSQATRDYCVHKGYDELFRRAGALLLEPGCGACINAGPGVSTKIGQVVISAQNRNFPGRSGPGDMYLASPLTVAASAVAGYITEYKPVA